MVEDLYSGMNLKIGAQADGGFVRLPTGTHPDVRTLRQVHGVRGLELTSLLGDSRGCSAPSNTIDADWCWTSEPGLRIGVKVADCTAILISGENDSGTLIGAAIHAGWRGTAAGIIENALGFLRLKSFHAWLSPSICQSHFEVGHEVLEAFPNSSGARAFARDAVLGKLFLDLKGIQFKQIEKFGGEIRSSSLCTYCQSDFVSYRRDGASTVERHLAWIQLKSQ